MHLSRNKGLIVYSQYLSRNIIDSYPPATQFASKWDDVIQMLRAKYSGQPRVVVYPYAGIQEQEIPLDG